MVADRQTKDFRRGIYFDLICGVISSVLALIGILNALIFSGIFSIGWFTLGVTFWTGYLLFSFLLIGLGIHTWKKEKNFDKSEQKKDLKAPIV